MTDWARCGYGLGEAISRSQIYGQGADNLAKIIKAVRRILDLPRTEFARRITSELGLSVKFSDVTLGNLEKSNGTPSMETLLKIGFYIPDPEEDGRWLSEIDLYLIWRGGEDADFWPDGYEETEEFAEKVRRLSDRLALNHANYEETLARPVLEVDSGDLTTIIKRNMEARGMDLAQFAALTGLAQGAIEELMKPSPTVTSGILKIRLSMIAPFLINPVTGAPFASADELISSRKEPQSE